MNKFIVLLKNGYTKGRKIYITICKTKLGLNIAQVTRGGIFFRCTVHFREKYFILF